MKFRKIQLKRTGDDEGIVEIRNIEIRPILAINRPISQINRRLFPEIGVVIFGRILS
jgi:hypothetical protein